ncbi:MAG: hypothetical protein LW698_13655 [Planctomycetaceae bacterium]|jgi:hypothetical protein|nr:hypothetical protein [Planctomycetaceae bacterium]
MPRPIVFAVAVTLAVVACRTSSGEPYNPYAVAPAVLPPVAPDGTIQWGTFFKSAQLQLSYERLWNMGACRGTNKAITEPVAENKLLIDRLPEADFAGVVQAANGTRAGGVVAFAAQGAAGQAPAYFAQLHPAGVSHLTVTGPVSLGDLRPGMAVRIRATVDERGRGTEPLRAVTVVTPAADFAPEPIRPGKADAVIATIVSLRGATLVVRVDAGKIRRLTFTLADDVVATVDGARLDLVSTGDTIEVKGRLWSGEGCAGAGTIFASRVTVTKRLPARPETREVAKGAGVAPGRAVE